MLRSVKYGVNGAVLAGLIAAPALWKTVDKSVELVVDGRSVAIQTTAMTVGQVLDAKGYRVSAHDLLAPRVSTKITDGTRIVLRRGRLLNLDVDGVATHIWTTAPTVATALAELGYTNRDFVSVSRYRRLPLGVTDIAIRTPRQVTVVHDGKTEKVSSTDATVGLLIADLGLMLGPDDRLSLSPNTPVKAGQTIRIQRVKTALRSTIRLLPFRVTKHRDAGMFVGHTEVIRAGHKGRARDTYSYVYVDGKPAGRTKVRTVILSRPAPRVLRVGTRQRPVNTLATRSAPSTPYVPNAPTPSPGTAKAIAREMVANRGWGPVQFDCLVTLWDHESGWRVHAANSSSGAYGIPQALPGWKMSSAGSDWQNSAATQIRWGLGYIAGRYNTPCGAWSFWQGNNWY